LLSNFVHNSLIVILIKVGITHQSINGYFDKALGF